MTTRQLLTFFEEFYMARYSDVFLDVMAGYLEKLSPAIRQAAATVIVKRFSNAFGKLPGPAEIENHMAEIVDAMPKPKFLPGFFREISDEEREEGKEFLEKILKHLERTSK